MTSKHINSENPLTRISCMPPLALRVSARAYDSKITEIYCLLEVSSNQRLLVWAGERSRLGDEVAGGTGWFCAKEQSSVSCEGEVRC